MNDSEKAFAPEVTGIVKCPECGSTTLVQDRNTGETVCAGCGLVVSKVEFAPPPERIPRVESRSYYGVTSFATGTERVSSLQRTESNVARDIDRIASRLALPNHVKLSAVVYMRKLLKSMRGQQKDVKTRLTGKELAVVSVWGTIKITGIPMSMNEYAAKINELFSNYTAGDVLKLENRASNFAVVATKVPDPADYVSRVTAKLDGAAEYAYLSLIGGYAVRMIRESGWIGKNRRPTLIAAAALLAADDFLGRKVGAERIAKTTGAGSASILHLATAFKRCAPAPPHECAALRFERFIGGEMLC